jgi:hypothetical protein
MPGLECGCKFITPLHRDGGVARGRVELLERKERPPPLPPVGKDDADACKDRLDADADTDIEAEAAAEAGTKFEGEDDVDGDAEAEIEA